MDPHLERASLLMQQDRYDMAEKEIGQALVRNPDDAYAHAMLAVCLISQRKAKDGEAEARQAIGLAPDFSFAHWSLSYAFSMQERWKEAEAAIRTAIELDPSDPFYHERLGDIRMAREDWAGAVESAEQGLALDAKHAGCLNTRALALNKLGRTEEAARTIEGVLADNPEDAFSHCTRGWTALHQSEPHKALEHFREALRLNPELEAARDGMVTALKAQYWVYRVMLQFFLWMSRQGKRYQWAIVIAIFVGQQVAASVARNSPALAPVAWPLYYAILAFGLSTWLADPLFNLLLRFNRFGRHAVTPEQKACSAWVGLCLLSALVVVVYGFAADSLVPRAAAFGLVIFAVAAASVYEFAAGWPRRLAAAFTLLLAGVNASALSHYHEGITAGQQAAESIRLVRVEPKETDPKGTKPTLKIEQNEEQAAEMQYHLGVFKDRMRIFSFGILALLIGSQLGIGKRMSS